LTCVIDTTAKNFFSSDQIDHDGMLMPELPVLPERTVTTMAPSPCDLDVLEEMLSF